jgi:hypothetical protein
MVVNAPEAGFGASGAVFGASGVVFGASTVNFGAAGAVFGASAVNFGAWGGAFGAAKVAFGLPEVDLMSVGFRAAVAALFLIFIVQSSINQSIKEGGALMRPCWKHPW